MKAITRGSTKTGNKCVRMAKTQFRSQDIFGKKVEFTFKGKRSYQTDIGAFVSIILKVVLCIFICYEIYVIFSREHPRVSMKQELIGPGVGFNPFNQGFDMMIAIRKSKT